MGAGNHSYRNKTTGALVTATRIVKMNFKHPHGVPHTRSTGDDKNESYAVSTPDGDMPANPGDWVVDAVPQPNCPLGLRSVMSHADFSWNYVPIVRPE